MCERQIMRVLSMSVLVVISLAFVAQAQQKDAAAMQVVRMSQPGPSLSFLPLYAARANHFFEEEGIKLEVTIMRGGGPEMQALIAGSVEFSATGTSGLIKAYSGGLELLGIQNILNRCTSDLVIRKDAAERLGITEQLPVEQRLKRLKGIKIGASNVGSLTYEIGYFLVLEAGLTPGKDVTILGVGDGTSRYAALKVGHVDVMISAPPFPAAAVKEGVGWMLVANTKGEYPKLRSFLQQILVVRPDLAKKDPDLVKRVVRALTRGNRWVVENSSENVAKMSAQFFKGIDADVLLSDVETMKMGIVPDGRITLEGLQGVEAVYRATGVVKEPIKWDRIITNDFLPF